MSVVTLYEKMSQVLSKPKKVQSTWLEDKALPFLAKNLLTAPSKDKKTLAIASNLCKSYQEGLQNGENCSFKDLYREIALLQPIVETDSVEASELHHYDENTVKALNKYKKFTSLVPNSSAKSVISLRMPLLVINKSGMHLDVLKKNGMADDNVFGYPVLKNQLVFGFNYEKFLENYKGDWETATTDLIDRLFEKTKRRFIALGKPSKYKQLFWVWLVEEKDIRALNNASFGNHLVVQKWAFPFDSTVKF